MTFLTFRQLAAASQVRWVLRHGNYLIQRWENPSWVNLYHLADDGRGFFVELGTADSQSVVLRSFVRSGPLAAYTPYLRLPSL